MALYEYRCDACEITFEQITTSADPEAGKCPKCLKNDSTHRLISQFAVGGQGDLRESTLHGCHGGFTGLPGDTGKGGGDSGCGHQH